MIQLVLLGMNTTCPLILSDPIAPFLKHICDQKNFFFLVPFGYGYDSQGINYSDLTRKMNWLAEHDPGNQPRSRDFSIERYALSMMNMALTSNVSDGTEVWMDDDMHCMWPSVECSQGFVVNLDLTKV